MDSSKVLAEINSREAERVRSLQEDTVIRLWDGNWALQGYVSGEFSHSFKFLLNDAGEASISLPLDNPAAQLLMSPDGWPTKSMYLTFDRDGVRWSGRVINVKTVTEATGDQQVEVSALHDYAKLKELLVWSNPFLPAEVQFPKAWMLFGPSRWAVTATLFVNLLRKNNSLWMLPDDPLDLGQWFDLDMSNWSMAVKPVKFGDDSSLSSVVSSRFKYFHDCVKDVCADAELAITCRRYLDGDPQPIEGKTLRNGCLVFDVEDKSGWGKQTAFGGSLITGLARAYRRMGSDGLTEGVDYVPRVEQPDEYFRPGLRGSLPEAPWVVLEHGDRTGVDASEYEYFPPGPSQFVTGGSSMPGVNEALKATIIGLGGVVGSLFNQSQLGSVAEAVLEPLYSDVFAAFMAHKYHDRIREQGWDFPFEHWVDGSDKAYTLSALTALRKAKHETREKHAVTVKMQSGAPYFVGSDFFIGDRVAVHALGMRKDMLFVEQVEELEFSSDPDEHGWSVDVGKTSFDSGLSYLAERFERATAGLKELGVW